MLNLAQLDPHQHGELCRKALAGEGIELLEAALTKHIEWLQDSSGCANHYYKSYNIEEDPSPAQDVSIQVLSALRDVISHPSVKKSGLDFSDFKTLVEQHTGLQEEDWTNSPRNILYQFLRTPQIGHVQRAEFNSTARKYGKLEATNIALGVFSACLCVQENKQKLYHSAVANEAAKTDEIFHEILTKCASSEELMRQDKEGIATFLYMMLICDLRMLEQLSGSPLEPFYHIAMYGDERNAGELDSLQNCVAKLLEIDRESHSGQVQFPVIEKRLLASAARAMQVDPIFPSGNERHVA